MQVVGRIALNTVAAVNNTASLRFITYLFLFMLFVFVFSISQPFTAPENIPRISCFCPAMNMEMDGRIISTTPAIINVIDWESTLSSIPIPICTVRILSDPVTSNGHMYIFHALINVYTAIAPIADFVSGIRICQINRRLEQPSIFADSYSEIGNVR